jgi:hypothetical protein
MYHPYSHLQLHLTCFIDSAHDYRIPYLIAIRVDRESTFPVPFNPSPANQDSATLEFTLLIEPGNGHTMKRLHKARDPLEVMILSKTRNSSFQIPNRRFYRIVTKKYIMVPGWMRFPGSDGEKLLLELPDGTGWCMKELLQTCVECGCYIDGVVGKGKNIDFTCGEGLCQVVFAKLCSHHLGASVQNVHSDMMKDGDLSISLYDYVRLWLLYRNLVFILWRVHAVEVGGFPGGLPFHIVSVIRLNPVVT